MKLIDKQEIELSLKKLVSAIKLTTERVQTIAVQAIAYSITKGDVDVANKLFEAVSTNKALRKDSLVKYLEVMGHLAFDTKDKKFKWLHNAKINCDRVITPEHEATIMAMRWDDAKKPPEITSEWDMEAQFRQFIGRMQKVTLDPHAKIANSDVLQVLSREFNRLSAEKTLKSMVVDEKVIEQGKKVEKAIKARNKAAKVEAALPVIEPGLAVANG